MFSRAAGTRSVVTHQARIAAQMTAMPFVSYERTVFYRERSASMYSSFPYSTALALVEARCPSSALTTSPLR